MNQTKAFSLSIFDPKIVFAVFLSEESAMARYTAGPIPSRSITIEPCTIVHRKDEDLRDGMPLFANVEEFQKNHIWYTSENLAREDHGLMPESFIIDDCTLYF